MTNRLQVTAEQRGHITIVTLVGEASIDIEHAEFQMDRIIAGRPETVILDVSQLSFLASIGMRLLVNLRRNVVSRGGSIKMVGVQPRIESALRTACLLDLFQHYLTLQSAFDACPAPPNAA